MGILGNLPDLMGDSKLWQWANISFGEYNVMLLQASMKKLLQSSGASMLRLWGKIKGINSDYFIAEGTLELREEEANEVQEEPSEVRG